MSHDMCVSRSGALVFFWHLQYRPPDVLMWLRPAVLCSHFFCFLAQNGFLLHFPEQNNGGGKQSHSAPQHQTTVWNLTEDGGGSILLRTSPSVLHPLTRKWIKMDVSSRLKTIYRGEKLWDIFKGSLRSFKHESHWLFGVFVEISDHHWWW